MTVVIVARQRSTRFPNKHLYMIQGKSLIQHITEQWYIHGAKKVILATGPKEWNARLGADAKMAGAFVHYEEEATEFNVLSRITNVIRIWDLEKLIIHSGDVLFPNYKEAQYVWDGCQPPEVIRCAVDHLHPRAGEMRVVCLAAEYYLDLDARLGALDPSREAFGAKGETERGGRFRSIPSPWPMAMTPMKVSIDYPLEACVAAKIVEHLGKWPEDAFEVEKAYKEITEL